MNKIIWRRDGFYRRTTNPNELWINGVGLACELANIASGRIVSAEKVDAITGILAMAEYFGHFGVASLIKQTETSDQALKTLITEVSALIAMWSEGENLQTMVGNKPLDEPLFASHLSPPFLKVSEHTIAFDCKEVELI